MSALGQKQTFRNVRAMSARLDTGHRCNRSLAAGLSNSRRTSPLSDGSKSFSVRRTGIRSCASANVSLSESQTDHGAFTIDFDPTLTRNTLRRLWRMPAPRAVVKFVIAFNDRAWFINSSTKRDRRQHRHVHALFVVYHSPPVPRATVAPA
jgi:hypothetical protein